MLQGQHLRKSYGAVTVISDVSFILNGNQHVGLIGPNGVGKSTLLRCLIGAEQLDAGTIVKSPSDLSIGYLAQSFGDLGERSVGEVVAAARADVLQAERDLQAAAEALATASDVDAALARYDAALARFEALGGYEHERRAAAVLQGLGLGGVDPATPVAVLSGGQKTRLGLAALLISEPDLLLLDEPTNHLDVEALAWLEDFVQGYPHTVLIVSHDREFLDRTVQSYPGNYRDFTTARAHERELQAAAWHEQQTYIQQVESDIRRVQGPAQSIQRGPKRARDFYGRVAAKVARLQLALLVLRGCNLLLLDEPLNHLDIEGREYFEAALDAFAGTVLAVSHDRAFLRGFAERVVEVRAG